MCPTVADTPALIANPATYSAIAAAISAAAAFSSYWINRSSLASKLTDRLYDFDKWILGNPCEFKKFIAQATREKADYFAASAPEDEDHIRLKALAYYYLNLFDEIFEAYGRRRAANDTWKAWQHYMFERMKHPLVKEMLLKECHLLIQDGRPIQVHSDGAGVFSARFVEFLVKNYDNWKGPCSPRFW